MLTKKKERENTIHIIRRKLSLYVKLSVIKALNENEGKVVHWVNKISPQRARV